jgi:hypothetical protein
LADELIERTRAHAIRQRRALCADGLGSLDEEFSLTHARSLLRQAVPDKPNGKEDDVTD